jgi:hypothetical protein
LGSNPGATAWGPLILSLICLALLTVSGSLGGKLAYRFGVRVVAESHQADGFVPSQRRSSDTAARPFSSEGA